LRTIRTGAVLVTGSPRRIGRSLALAFARQGWDIALHCRIPDGDTRALADAVRALGVTAEIVACDLSDLSALPRLVHEACEKVGPLSCLINNASVFLEDAAQSVTPESWHANMTVNLAAPVLLSQAFAKALPAGLSGNIVNVVDQRVWRTTPEYFSYSLAKSALWTATRMLAQAFAPRIRVNAVGPGPALKNIHQTDADFAAEARSTLLGHGTTPDEIAAAVLYLVQTRAVTGQMIALDGGQHLVWQPLAGSDNRGGTDGGPFGEDPSGRNR